MNFGVHVLPKVTTTYNLGSTDKKWNNIYGTLKGNADTATALTSNAGSSSIPIYFTSGKPSAVSNISLVASDTNGKYVEVGNSNGTVKLFASTNRGMYDTTNSKWICYTAQAGDHTYIPLWASKGSSTQPVYFNSSGEPVAAGAYSSLLTALSWTAGTTAGPTLSITVGGTNKTSTIPSASATASGVVTTSAQTFAGIKTFTNPETINTTGNGAAVNFKFSNAATANEIYGQNWITYENTSGRFYWREWSGSSSGRTSYYEQYKLPACDASRTSNANYTIITTKNPADLGYYLPLSGGTMTGWITFDAEQGIYARIKRKKDGGGGWAYSPIRMIGNDNAMFFNIGVYGSANTLGYAYIGANDWNSTANTRIYADGHLTAPKVYGAVWNDYAEYRITKDKIEPGRCVIETGKDDLVLSTERLQPGAEIISDTFGFAIGETDEAKTPIATTGRVLAYIYEGREAALAAIGKPVCSGPDGTVSIMTDEEYQKYGYCAIGTISAVPDYEEWGTGNIKVNNRIWIRVR